MWQADTFDPKTVDQELGWAQDAGYNGVRVFLQYLVWKDDPDGLKKRINQFLSIAEKHRIRTMLMFFCDCSFSGKEPYLGKQDEPVPGVHNSGWVPSPGLKRVTDRTAWADLEKYVKDIVSTFGQDKRILIWDLYNEPGNSGMGEKSLPLVEATFAWAREANPSQPLTIGVWASFEGRMSKRIIELSDIVSFHAYDNPDGVRSKIKLCQALGRPLICTEFLRRQAGNTFASILPLFAQNEVGWHNWGLVAGRTQTYMHWGSKKGDPMPKVWQHDIFHPDGRPYDPKEIELIRAFAFDKPRSTAKRWSKEKAWEWYRKIGVIRGCNYVPSTAVNMMEWWQAETFDPETINRELDWARDCGYTTVRCNLPYLAWEHDPKGFKKRLDQFLAIADRQRIRVMFCLFDDVNFARATPHLGPQEKPVPGVHNSRWVPSPAAHKVTDRAAWPGLERYVKDVVGTFRADRRILAWDLYNEPGNGGLGEKSLPLVEAAFRWAREQQPSQPLTTGPWTRFDSKMSKRMLELSDITTFHCYGTSSDAERLIERFSKYGRPMVCTETIRRVPGKNFAAMLPVYARHGVGWYNWGLVAGKQQTYLPWEDRTKTINDHWHWDMLYPDGKPYDPKEIVLIRNFRFAENSTGDKTTINFSAIKSPIIFKGDSKTAYRDPAAIYHDGVLRLYFTLARREDDGNMYWYTAVSKSQDLINWTEPRILTPRNRNLNFSSPGNVIRYGNEWILCLQTYPTPRGETYGNKTARIWIMRSPDLETWSEPEMLRVKGPDVPVDEMGRMIDPYLVQDKDEPGKWWCFYKQSGASMSYSQDLKTWTYFGRVAAGENVCVLVDGDEYVMFHSPRNGVGVKRSKDLKNWRDVGLITLGQKEWPWAQGRLTAGFVLDLRDQPEIGRYIMFFHGSSKEGLAMHGAHGHGTLALAWSDDFVRWDWPGKQSDSGLD